MQARQLLSTLCTVGALLTTAAVARAEVQVHTTPVSTSDSASAAIPRFDHTLGFLESVRVELTVSLNGAVGFENVSPLLNTVEASFQAAATVSAPGGATLVSALPQAVKSTHILPAFDGRVDFAGDSGRTFINLNTSARVQNTLPGDTAWTTALLGSTGPVSLQIDVLDLTTIEGTQATLARHGLTADIELSVTYNYTPMDD